MSKESPGVAQRVVPAVIAKDNFTLSRVRSTHDVCKQKNKTTEPSGTQLDGDRCEEVFLSHQQLCTVDTSCLQIIGAVAVAVSQFRSCTV